MHASFQGATFHIEHIIPRCHGGKSVLENLALACPGCNLNKGSRINAVDPVTTESVRLFHPIQQRWPDHFHFRNFEVEGMTGVGRALVNVLNLNHPRRQRIRQIEKAFGLFPPN